jgi:hypothetical protein
MACQEMDLFYAYLDAVEAEKRKSQPWQCEVTVIGEDGRPRVIQSAATPELAAAPSGFACDVPE